MSRSPTEHENRASASVIVAARTAAGRQAAYDFQVLLFKRTVPTAYAPDHCVFPGGKFEAAADESPEWLEYFQEFGIAHAQLAGLTPRHQAGRNRPHPLLTSGVPFSRDISLRITAARETFEEVGVLLCRRRNSAAHARPGGYGQYFEAFDREHWQNAVHEDPKQFLRLCRHLQVVPDLWSLNEWSVWRSPITARKKFDTVFYLVALEEVPSLLPEKSEVDLAMWGYPPAFLRSFKNRTIWLAPILFYEVSRLQNVHNLKKLADFAQRRADSGSTLLMPVYYKSDEEYRIATLPGDDFYPERPELYTDNIDTECSLREFRQKAERRHRFIFRDMYDASIELTIPPLNDHLSPLPEDVLCSKL